MRSPATTTTALSQNGRRQPQLSRSSVGSAATGRKIAVASTWPNWVPPRVKLVKYARRFDGACSRLVDEAPACSPPAEKPCSRRSTTRMIGAAMPMDA